MSGVSEALTTNWDICMNFSRKIATAVVIPPTAIISSACIVALAILFDNPLSLTVAALSTVVWCSLSAVMSLYQRSSKCDEQSLEPPQTFFKKVMRHITSRSFIYGAIVGIGCFAALIAATRSKVYCTEELRPPCLNPQREEAGCCFEIELIRKRIKDGSIVVNNGPYV